MFRVNLLKGFLYPLTSLKRLVAAWLILPLSLAVLVPPILLGMGVLGTVSMNLQQGIGFTVAVALVCLLVGAFPFTFLAGYLLRCRKCVLDGEDRLPAWNRWGELLSDGGKMDTLAILIGVPTGLLFWSGVGVFGLSIKNLHDHHTWGAAALAVLGSGAGLGFLLCAFCVWLVVMFFSPIASLRLAQGHGPLAALSLSGMLKDIRRGWFDYLLCCCLVTALSVLFSLAQTAFWPLVVVSFPVQVYLQIVWASLLGQYARAYPIASPPEPASPSA